jgi:WD40 repeat protein
MSPDSKPGDRPKPDSAAPNTGFLTPRLLKWSLVAVSVAWVAVVAMYVESMSRWRAADGARRMAEARRVQADESRSAAEFAQAEALQEVQRVRAAAALAAKTQPAATVPGAQPTATSPTSAPTSTPAATVSGTRPASPPEPAMSISEYRVRIQAADAEWDRGRADDAQALLDECPFAMRGWEFYYLTHRFGGGAHDFFAPGNSRGPMFMRTPTAATFGRIREQVVCSEEPGVIISLDAAFPMSRHMRDLKTDGIMSPIYRLERHPAGDSFLVGLADNSVIGVDANYKPNGFVLPPQQWRRNSVRYSDDGKFVVSCTGQESTIGVYDSKTGAAIDSIRDNSNQAVDAVVSPIAPEVAIARRNGIVIRGINKVLTREITNVSPEFLRAVRYTRDGKRLVAAGRDLFLCDVETGKVTDTLRVSGGSPLVLAVAADGRRVAAGNSDQSISIWDIETKQEVQRLRGRMSQFVKLEFNTDGTRLLSFHSRGEVRLWRLDQQSDDPVYADHGSQLNQAWIVGPNDTVVSASSGGVYVWKNRKEHAFEIKPKDVGDKKTYFRAHAASGDGRWIATADSEGAIDIWDSMQPGAPRTTLGGVAEPAVRLEFTRDGKLLAIFGRDRTIRIWDREAGKVRYTVPAEQQVGNVFAFNADGARFVTGGGPDGVLRVWETSDGRILEILGTDTYMSAAFSPDGKWLAAGSSRGLLHFFDTADGRPLHGTSDRGGSREPRVMLLDGRVAGGRAMQPTIQISELVVSPDGKRLASVGSDAPAVRIWDAKTGVEMLKLARPTRRMLRPSFSADGRKLLSAEENGTIVVWDSGTGSTAFSRGPGISGMPFGPGGPIGRDVIIQDGMPVGSGIRVGPGVPIGPGIPVGTGVLPQGR